MADDVFCLMLRRTSGIGLIGLLGQTQNGLRAWAKDVFDQQALRAYKILCCACAAPLQSSRLGQPLFPTHEPPRLQVPGSAEATVGSGALLVHFGASLLAA